VLPPLLDELKYTPFKFWFEGVVQDGLYYQNELFCRLRSAPAERRAYLYQEACRLARDNAVVFTIGDRHCSLWVSLRSPNLADLKQQMDGYTADPA